MPQSKKLIMAATSLIVLFALLAVLSTIMKTPMSPLPVTETISEPATGTITGSLGYPSEVMPEQIICAEDLTEKSIFCTKKNIQDQKFKHGIGYELEVPAGTYHVYAEVPGNDYQAFYSEFVTCGFDVNCPSHEPISITVTRDETVSGIDPQDWYVY
jgi:hypothetical protein